MEGSRTRARNRPVPRSLLRAARCAFRASGRRGGGFSAPRRRSDRADEKRTPHLDGMTGAWIVGLVPIVIFAWDRLRCLRCLQHLDRGGYFLEPCENESGAALHLRVFAADGGIE